HLELAPDEIDVDSGYYEQGLTSASLLELVKAIGDKVGTVLPPILLFEYTTVSALAAYLSQHYGERFDSNDDEPPIASEEASEEANNTSSFEPSVLSPMDYSNGVAPAFVKSEPIAIIGMSGRFPMAQNLQEFWHNLVAGRDCISEIPADRGQWQIMQDLRSPSGKSMSRWGGFINDPDCFDPHFFRISPREAEQMDPQERLFLQVCWEAMEDGGYTPASLVKPSGPQQRRRVGVFAGVMHKDYALLGAHASAQVQAFPLAITNAGLANRVSYVCGFHGPSMAVDPV